MTDTAPTRPKPPTGLGASGKKLWNRIQGDLLDDQELDERETAVLEEAAKQAETNADLAKAIKRDGVMIEGAAGQTRLNAAVVELRNGRLAVARLLSQLDLNLTDDTPASRRARHAARSRWSLERTKRGRPSV